MVKVLKFSDHSLLLEKVEFKEKFMREITKRFVRSDKVAKYLVDYIKDNEDDFVDYVELADMFTTNRLIITSKNNKPQVMKMTRFLRKILPQNLISSDEIDKFVVEILASNISDTYFELWHGEKIRSAFWPENFIVKDGELANSCMSETQCQPYFDLYTQNKNVHMLVLLHESKIVARAIVWKALYSDRERIKNVPYHVMDKVYAINDVEEKKMIEYAKSLDWLYYSERGEHFKDKEGRGYYGSFIVKLEKVEFQHYPYVDNMMYLDKEKKELSNRFGVFMLHNKDGSLPSCTKCQDEHKLLCPDCEGTGTVNGANCKTCNGTAFIDCPECVK